VTFSDPLYLTFLVSVPFFIVLHFLILKRMRARALKFANFEALQRVTDRFIDAIDGHCVGAVHGKTRHYYIWEGKVGEAVREIALEPYEPQDQS